MQRGVHNGIKKGRCCFFKEAADIFQLANGEGQYAVKCFHKLDIADFIATELKKIAKSSMIGFDAALDFFGHFEDHFDIPTFAVNAHNLY